MRIESVICQFSWPYTNNYHSYQQEDITLSMYVLFTSLKYYCISSFFFLFLLFHVFHTSEEMLKCYRKVPDRWWCLVGSCSLFIPRVSFHFVSSPFFPFFFHLYYMGQENCGLLVIYAYKNTYPLAFCCFCEDGCEGNCMDGWVEYGFINSSRKLTSNGCIMDENTSVRNGIIFNMNQQTCKMYLCLWDSINIGCEGS